MLVLIFTMDIGDSDNFDLNYQKVIMGWQKEGKSSYVFRTWQSQVLEKNLEVSFHHVLPFGKYIYIYICFRNH